MQICHVLLLVVSSLATPFIQILFLQRWHTFYQLKNLTLWKVSFLKELNSHKPYQTLSLGSKNLSFDIHHLEYLVTLWQYAKCWLKLPCFLLCQCPCAAQRDSCKRKMFFSNVQSGWSTLRHFFFEISHRRNSISQQNLIKADNKVHFLHWWGDLNKYFIAGNFLWAGNCPILPVSLENMNVALVSLKTISIRKEYPGKYFTKEGELKVLAGWDLLQENWS